MLVSVTIVTHPSIRIASTVCTAILCLSLKPTDPAFKFLVRIQTIQDPFLLIFAVHVRMFECRFMFMLSVVIF